MAQRLGEWTHQDECVQALVGERRWGLVEVRDRKEPRGGRGSGGGGSVQDAHFLRRELLALYKLLLPSLGRGAIVKVAPTITSLWGLQWSMERDYDYLEHLLKIR